jgi:hypothetical protein
MRRRTTIERQLDLDWTDAMRWEELPPSVRAEAQQVLGDLLSAVAIAGAGAGAGDGDDGE